MNQKNSVLFRSCFLGFLLSLLFPVFSVRAQHANAFGVDAEFMQNNTAQAVTEVASNVIRVVNHTSSPVRFHFTFSLPQGWELIGDPRHELTVLPGDSIFQPVRLIPEKFSKGGTTYIVTAVLVSDKDVQFSACNWYINTSSNSRWKAYAPVRQIYFSNRSDSSGFKLRLQNLGNSEENIRVVLLPDRRLELFNPQTREPVALTFVVPLAVGADTMLSLAVRRKQDKNPYADKRDEPSASQEKNDLYSIQIMARNATGAGNQSWTGNIQFSRLGNHVRLNNFGRTAFPLTIEANVYDVLSTGTTMSFDAYGSTVLGENKFLNYRFQSVYVSNFMQENSFLGVNHYIGYFSDRMILELGEVNGWGRSLLSGKGIKGSYTLGKHTIGAMYVRTPGFFKKHTGEGYGFYHRFTLPKFTVSNYLSYQSNSALHLNTGLYNGVASIKLNRYNQVSVGGGLSSETFTSSVPGIPSAVHAGSGVDLNYSGSYKDIIFSAGGMLGSENYTLARGARMWNGRASYSFNRHYNLSLSAQSFQQRPTYYVNGMIVHGNYIRTDRYEVRWGINTLSSIIYVKPTYQMEENLSLHVQTTGLGLEYSAKNTGATRFSSNVFAGYVRMPDYNIPSFFISRINLYYRLNPLILSLRYQYGPGQITEQLRFISTGINPQTLNLSASHEYWFGSGKFLLSTNSNLGYETFFKKTSYRLRPELFYFSKSGFRWSVYGSFMSNSQAANPLLADIRNRPEFEKISYQDLTFGFGVKKEIGVPVPGKKYCSMRLIVFKDLNGNHRQDVNEEGMDNMLVNIRSKTDVRTELDSGLVSGNHGEDFVTNEKGELFFDNIPAGVYEVKATPLIAQGEWFDMNTLEVAVDRRQVTYLPLSRGTRLNGNILIERDKYSDQQETLDLSRIRVTAIDSAGKNYSCLTDRDGGFMLYLPMGIYTLQVENSSLGSRFLFVQSKLLVDLSRQVENYNVTFNVVECKRKMEIKKFGSEKEPH